MRSRFNNRFHGILIVAALPWIANCATSRTTVVARPLPQPREAQLEAEPARSTSERHETPLVEGPEWQEGAIVETALGLRGTPYRNGGSDLIGFDCSGFTQYVFARHGVRLPREVRDQFRLGSNVRLDDLAVGDLIFFTTTSRGPSHVAIAIGAGDFVHAPSSRGVVRVEHLSTRYWAERVVAARRLTPR